MRNLLFFSVLAFILYSTTLFAQNLNMHKPMQPQLDKIVLPSNFSVYTKGTVVITHSEPGFTKKPLITNNDFKGTPGCYIACYTHSNKHAVYSVSKDIFVYGLIRVPGHYEVTVCRPQGFETADISAEPKFKNLCASKISTCKNAQCWAGGDTGGWLVGLQ